MRRGFLKTKLLLEVKGDYSSCVVSTVIVIVLVCVIVIGIAIVIVIVIVIVLVIDAIPLVVIATRYSYGKYCSHIDPKNTAVFVALFLECSRKKLTQHVAFVAGLQSVLHRAVPHLPSPQVLAPGELSAAEAAEVSQGLQCLEVTGTSITVVTTRLYGPQVDSVTLYLAYT